MALAVFFLKIQDLRLVYELNILFLIGDIYVIYVVHMTWLDKTDNKTQNIE